MAKLTEQEKLERTRALLSAPPREELTIADLLQITYEFEKREDARKKVQPRPDEIGYV